MNRPITVVLAVAALAMPARTVLAQQKPTKTTPVPIWQLEPFDRITLFNEDVHDIDAVRIPPGTKFENEPDEYIGTPGLPPLRDTVRQSLYRIRLQNNGREYYVYGRSVIAILLYENMLLEKARALVGAGKLDEAYEYLRTIEDRKPDWPGLVESKIAFHREESEKAALAGEWPLAFSALAQERRLQARRDAPQAAEGALAPIDADLKRRIDQVADRWTEVAVGQRRFAEGRKVVARLEDLVPDSSVAANWRRKLADQAARSAAESDRLRQANNPRAALAAAQQAASIVPNSPVVRAALERQYQGYGELRVAVDHLPGYRFGLSGWTVADWRCNDLINIPLVRSEGGASNDRFASRVIDAFEQSNINKRVTLSIREGLRWSGDGKPVTVVDVHRLLVESTRPDSPMYHPALALTLIGSRPELPSRLIVDFDRPQVQPQAWFQTPFVRTGPRVAAVEATSDAVPDVIPTASPFDLYRHLGPYRLALRAADRVSFVANEAFLEPGKPSIGQLTEIRYPTPSHQLQALRRAEVDLVASVPPRLRELATEIEGVRLIPAPEPSVHVLQFDFNRRELRNRALRRLIGYAIDRSAVFAAIGLPVDAVNRPITGPLPYGSFGYDASIEPRPFDRGLAKALLFGLRKKIKAIPPLTLAHTGDATSLVACRAIVADLSAIGLTVNLVDVDHDSVLDPVTADLCYRQYVVSDPVFDLITLLYRDNPSLNRHGTPWLRQLMVELTQTPNLSAARDLLPQLHRALHDDVAILPLWQWVDHAAARAVVRLPTEEPTRPYRGIIDWTVRPSYPQSHWQVKP